MKIIGLIVDILIVGYLIVSFVKYLKLYITEGRFFKENLADEKIIIKKSKYRLSLLILRMLLILSLIFYIGTILAGVYKIDDWTETFLCWFWVIIIWNNVQSQVSGFIITERSLITDNKVYNLQEIKNITITHWTFVPALEITTDDDKVHSLKVSKKIRIIIIKNFNHKFKNAKEHEYNKKFLEGFSNRESKKANKKVMN